MDSKINKALSRARDGDENSMLELLQQYKPMMEHAVGRASAKLSDSGISDDDLMQEAMIAFSSAIGAYDPERGVTFGAFARTCVNNRLVSVARKAFSARRRKRTLPSRSVRTSSSKGLSDSLVALRPILTDYEREVLGFTVQGYKPAEISGMLDRPVKSVYNALCRIKAKAAHIKL